MLIVKDVEKLSDYGFRKNGYKNSKQEEIWEKFVGKCSDNLLLYLVVNPCFSGGSPAGTLELVITSENDEADKAFPVETIMKMLTDKVVGWVPDKEAE